MACGDVCGDNRFEIIEAAKKELLSSTNIESSEKEMEVLDSFLFRCWQMGWIKEKKTTNLTFGEALEYVKRSHLALRKGWNGKGMFIFIRPHDTLEKDFVVNTVKSLPPQLKNWIRETHKEDYVKFSAYLCLKSEDGTIVNGWLPSQSDLLAEDWQVIFLD